MFCLSYEWSFCCCCCCVPHIDFMHNLFIVCPHLTGNQSKSACKRKVFSLLYASIYQSFFYCFHHPGILCCSRFFAPCHDNSCDFFCAPQHLFKSLDRYLQRIDTISLKENDSSACFFPDTITKPSFHDCIRGAFSLLFSAFLWNFFIIGMLSILNTNLQYTSKYCESISENHEYAI